ncbi:hypothetical protein [Mangrovibrevibacter kandeliae]|uniref:hypothetical protein n=1 Tax=Mangrovibrevibacter kandeliae TaxID=2968473 RepID=UPI002117A1AF|nr:hypothetical protein [Aurantimonas sp. CSK15Z-1]MCQ8784160.1 hypothetical protein [Aurantimonas sp. CSK15Z-1]
MRRVALFAFGVAVVIGVGTACFFGIMMLQHNPQGEFCAYGDSAPPDACTLKPRFYLSVAWFFLLGMAASFLPVTLLLASIGRLIRRAKRRKRRMTQEIEPSSPPGR